MNTFVKSVLFGMYSINQMISSDSYLPFGGTKSSGFGRELVEFRLREFSNIKSE